MLVILVNLPTDKTQICVVRIYRKHSIIEAPKERALYNLETVSILHWTEIDWKMVDGTFSFTMQTNVDKDQVKAAIKSQQDQQIDNASILTWNF